MAPNVLALATTLEILGARWLLAKKVNFVPCQGVKSQQLPLECAPDEHRIFFKNNWFLVSVHPLSFGCVPQVAKHERNVRVAQVNSQVRLKLTMNEYCFMTLTLFLN